MAYWLHYTKYPLVLEGYCDANWIYNHNEGKSTSGYVFTLGGAAISWKSSKQTVNTRSTMEAKFIALDKAAEEAEWLRSFLEGIPLWPKPVDCLEYYGIILIGITYTRLMFGRIFGNQLAKLFKILMNKDMFHNRNEHNVNYLPVIGMQHWKVDLVLHFSCFGFNA
uniref:ATP phosphoribosyltransferase 1, chloroplastic n=1 Tax=Tanacetum cinerariifolium TaxID=118510 RepID=A0A699HLF5_TANCI|nr:ATP phosphoribosyltransferase 1, chloroplastic [Tanacetum cinerariifolium]